MPALDRLRRAASFLALLASLSAAADSIQPLPALNIDIAQTSVSGISSGGFMAVQFQVAHSAIVKGAGVVAAGPYYCSQDDALTAMTRCSCTGGMLYLGCAVTASSADVPALLKATRRFAAAGLIDDPANVAHQRLITFAGGKDGT
ncbi:MAG TPA: poly(3-hydroxybutyrate) depolymerase, partial [Rhodocyclaceae bacterium]|nr:poly(3-hydroxybutyrate) depolymerase [Rhodocyclaceae bacterium]